MCVHLQILQVGIVESITLKNFMCHSLLGPFTFGNNVNFVVGNNGSEFNVYSFHPFNPFLFTSVIHSIVICAFFLCSVSKCYRWKECCSDCSHSGPRGEGTDHKQGVLPQGICERRRKVKI